MLMPVIDLNNSPDRCTEVPAPPEQKFSLPEFALACAMNSGTDFTGKLRATVITLGTRISPATGAMSFKKLKLRLG